MWVIGTEMIIILNTTSSTCPIWAWDPSLRQSSSIYIKFNGQLFHRNWKFDRISKSMFCGHSIQVEYYIRNLMKCSNVSYIKLYSSEILNFKVLWNNWKFDLKNSVNVQFKCNITLEIWWKVSYIKFYSSWINDEIFKFCEITVP